MGEIKMAFIIIRTCIKCGESYDDYTSLYKMTSHTCAKCKNKESENRKQQHFDKLDNMTIEQRLRRIEKIQYNNSLVKVKIPYKPNAIYG